MAGASPEVTYAGAVATAVEQADLLVAGAARDVHRAVSRRVFRAVGPVAEPVRAVHDALSRPAYAAVSVGLRGLAGGLRLVERARVLPSLESGVSGRQVRSAVNGLVGQSLLDAGDPLAVTCSVRQAGRDVGLTAPALRAAYPAATGRVAVLLHGLCEDDETWDRRARRGRGTSYPEVLDAGGVTPVLLRYNTGRRVADSGAAVAEVLERLVAAWPVPVTAVSLVGHSMGGLVARAALAHGEAGGTSWFGLVRSLVCLGSPHGGAVLEKSVTAGVRAMRWVPEAQPFARILDQRSPGILDLRHGYTLGSDGDGADLLRQWGRPVGAGPALPAGASVHLVAATVTASKDHPVARLVGDGLVRVDSASGVRRSESVLTGAEVRHLPSAGHLSLLHHPTVAGWLVEWLAPPASPPAGRR